MEERRCSARHSPAAALYGKVKATLPARVLDISPLGVRIEVGSALRPAADCDLALPVGGQELRLRARVLRCRAQARRPTETGGIVFRAGLESVGVSDEVARALEAAYGPTAETTARAKGSAWPPRPAGAIRIRVNVDQIRRKRGE